MPAGHYVLVGCDSETPETTMCKKNCRNSTALLGVKSIATFDPIGFCLRECERTQGNCPASDGSGGLFTGCEVYGATGGLLNY
jgi:hypothetical protein